jgi:hypothetical protein
MINQLATYKSGTLEAVELYKGIYQIDNALQPEDILYLRTLAEGLPQDSWKERNHEVLHSQAVELYGEEAEEDIAAYIERNHSAYWDDKIIKIPDTAFNDKINQRLAPFFEGLYDLAYLEEVQRQYEGVGLDEHVDAEYDSRIKFAVVMYINDDFTGGELYFPLKGIEIKPKAGSCLIFDTGKEFLHGVRKVGPGPGRYAMAGFAWEYGTGEGWIASH